MTQLPSHIDEQLRFQHQMTLEAQRHSADQKGFPISHPLAPGEIPLHPNLATCSLPRGPQELRHFHTEPKTQGERTATSTQERGSKVNRQKSRRDATLNREPSFLVLPLEENKQWKNMRSQSSIDLRDKMTKPFSLFQGGPSKTSRGEIEGRKQSQQNQQWFMKEKNDLNSLSSLVSPSATMEDNLIRSDKMRSSFGMILKDKFQRNPNMYFPDTTTSTKLGRSDKLCKRDSLSDTDTLIRNMSEGSFDKSSSTSQSIGSHSSGKSSQDSMHGTPMMRRKKESITVSARPQTTAMLLPSSPGVMLNRKTIRNYAPPQSTDMLKQFEEIQT